MTLSKLREIKVLLQTAKFDILGITETKLTSRTTDEQLDIEGCKFIKKDREKEDGGGGCMLYYLEDLDLYETDIIRTKLEAIRIDVELHSQQISLSMMYRPPKDQNFSNTLSDEIEKLWAQKKIILIMGDLNADILRRYSENEDDEKAAGKKLLHVIDRFGFENVIKYPTRVTTT